MLRLAIAALAAALCCACQVKAEAAPEPLLLVPFNPAEKQFLLQMCEAAKYASRITYDVACDQLKAKFTEAEKKAAAAPAVK